MTEREHCKMVVLAFRDEAVRKSYASESAVIANWWLVADLIQRERKEARMQALEEAATLARQGYELADSEDCFDLLAGRIRSLMEPKEKP